MSIINLASVRDLGQRLGRPLDPLRFRANLYVEGWPAWAENEWEGRAVTLGAAEAKVFKPIVRCAAPGVEPANRRPRRSTSRPSSSASTATRLCGIYVQVTGDGAVKEGDAVGVS